MKKLIFLTVLLAGVAVMAAAPDNNSVSETVASQVIDSQHTGTWELIDSMIVIKTDTCNTFYHISGTVTLNLGERFYIGVSDGDAISYTTYKDSVRYPYQGIGAQVVPFGYVYVDSLRSQTDANDTIYFYGACLGSGPTEAVTITSVRMTGTVIDVD